MQKMKKAAPKNLEVLKQPYVRIPVELHEQLSRIAQKHNLIPYGPSRRSQVNVGIARLLQRWASEEEGNV